MAITISPIQGLTLSLQPSWPAVAGLTVRSTAGGPCIWSDGVEGATGVEEGVGEPGAGPAKAGSPSSGPSFASFSSRSA